MRERFGDGTSLLERYATRFDAVEITSSFYRPHRASTYARWAASVPAGFRFALKVPKQITHEQRLVNVADALRAFLDATDALGERRDVLLVQLAPKHAYDDRVADAFFAQFREQYAGRIACEPRHPSWFNGDAEALLVRYDVARVAADPAPVPEAAHPGGSPSFVYRRLHGSPVIYRSSYGEGRLHELAVSLMHDAMPSWCIFDNTTLGAAAENALIVAASLAERG